MANSMTSAGLFDDERRPLADRLRPQSLDQVLGQPHLIGEEGRLTKLLKKKHLPSILFWGPPGTGKTTIARLIAEQVDCHFTALSAVFSGVAEMRKEFLVAKERKLSGQQTLLFVDELHRFNRAQQDALLPVIEDGTVIFIAATTENPGFSINSALLSRLQIFPLEPLDENALQSLLAHAENFCAQRLNLVPEAREQLLRQADGDGRQFLNMLEVLFQFSNETPLGNEEMIKLLGQHQLRYDRTQDEHYNLISALHKSLRGSHTQAALYWLARMLVGGEDGNYIARRLLRFAYEDIGLAEPNVANEVLCAWQTYERLGSPEGEIALVQAVIRMASAPKSNAVYVAEKNAKKLAKESGSAAPPKNLINAANSFMRKEGFGAGYVYEHDTETGVSGQDFFPKNLGDDICLYTPCERGFEREVKKRLAYFEKLRQSVRQSEG